MRLRIESYSRKALMIASASRAGIMHLVDFEGHDQEPIVCTCEAFILGHARPCRHMQMVTIPMV